MHFSFSEVSTRVWNLWIKRKHMEKFHKSPDCFQVWLYHFIFPPAVYKEFDTSHPSVQSSSVAQSCSTLCDPMNCSTPGLPVHHQLLQFTQTHVHQASDAIQPPHPLSFPSPPAPNPSQHQSLFQLWHEVAKVLGVSALASVLPMNTQD